MNRTPWIARIVLAACLAGGCFFVSSPTPAGAADVNVGGVAYPLGEERPVFVSVSGFTGEASEVIRFDLYVQGFAFTNAEAAQYVLSGSNDGSLQGRAVDVVNKSVVVSQTYAGASPRRQAHAFVDDFLRAINRIGIGQTEIAFKGEKGLASEIYVADFDGHNAQELTHDRVTVAAPCWVPGHRGLYYTSYLKNHPDIYFYNVATGARRIFARYGGCNISPAVSPDGSRVAMILSKDGWIDLYVGTSDGSTPLRLTKSPQDESSPCWSFPDGQWICYASKENERRSLSIIPAGGGKPQRLNTAGFPSPSEPDWSPDGNYIAFTSQSGAYFSICVMSAPGRGTQTPVRLVEGEDPSWSPNSRTLIFARRAGGKGNYVLSLLDVKTKQVKDVSRISGISSQSQPSWAK